MVVVVVVVWLMLLMLMMLMMLLLLLVKLAVFRGAHSDHIFASSPCIHLPKGHCLQLNRPFHAYLFFPMSISALRSSLAHSTVHELVAQLQLVWYQLLWVRAASFTGPVLVPSLGAPLAPLHRIPLLGCLLWRRLVHGVSPRLVLHSRWHAADEATSSCVWS